MRYVLVILTVILANSAFGLVNGVPLMNAHDIVRIKFANGWVCSGVYIDHYTILTAAHCLITGSEPLKIDKIESEEDTRLNVKQVSLLPNPLYSDQYWHEYDVGLIKTTRNDNFSGQYQIQDKALGYLRDAILIGTGKSDYDNKIYSRTFGENKFFRIGAVLFFIGENNHNLKNQPGINVSVAPNDSGGPIIDKVTGKIVGVMTTTTLKASNNFHLPTISTGTSVQVEHNLSFIKDNLGPPKL